MAEILIFRLPPANPSLDKRLKCVSPLSFLNKPCFLTASIDPPQIWVYTVKSG